MDEPLVLGVDIGSSTAKAVLATVSGRIVATAAGPQRVLRLGAGRVEQDPEEWWQAIRELVARTLGTVQGTRSAPLIALAISGHFPTFVACDAEGRPLMRAILYADSRGDGWVAEASRIAGESLRGDELLPKLLWMRDERPELLRAIRLICYPQEHVLLRLTGDRATDHRRAARSGGFLDRSSLAWRADVLGVVGLDLSVLPRIARPGEPAGYVTAAASEATGIPAGTPVLVGVGDTPAVLLGSGVIRKDDVLLYYGTTTTADVCTHDMESYLVDPSPIAEGAPYEEVAYAVLGPALVWAAQGFAGSDQEPIDLEGLDREASAIGTERNAPYVLPFFMAHSHEGGPARRTAIIGLDVHHRRADLHRALLESFGYMIRAGLEDSGAWNSALRFVAAGGGAKSATWRQTVSDVLGAEQTWLPSSDGALGDAMLAAWAMGATDTFRGGLKRWLAQSQTTVPDPEANAVHEVRYQTWRRLARATWDAVQTGGD